MDDDQRDKADDADDLGWGPDDDFRAELDESYRAWRDAEDRFADGVRERLRRDHPEMDENDVREHGRGARGLRDWAHAYAARLRKWAPWN